MDIILVFITLLIPIMMVLFGKLFLKNPPRTINEGFGYRTKKSMQNQNTWTYAHKVCGELWVKLGGLMAMFSVAVCIITFFLSQGVRLTILSLYPIFQVLVMILSILVVEKKLTIKFDETGNLRK